MDKKIFIEIPTWLGDAVMTTPAIENIIQIYPNCKLTIFGSYVSTQLFINHPNIDKIIVDDSKKSGFRYKNLYNLAKKVGKVDIALSFRQNFTTKFLLYFIDAKDKYIYKRYDTSLTTHQVIRYNDFINKSFGTDLVPAGLKLYFDPIKKEKETVGLNPGATYGSAKRWYPLEFAKVAIALSKEYDIVIFGGANEKDIAKDIEEYLKENNISNVTNKVGKTTIPELVENIASLDLFITNDSGPMHIAAAYSIPTVAIFGPTRDKETHQWANQNEMIIRHDIECAPCMKRVCPLKHHKCMKNITSDDVLRVLKEKNYIK